MNHSSAENRPKRIGLLFLLSSIMVAAVLCGGCSSKPPQGEVHGRITWKEKAVTAGVVSLYSPTLGTGGNALIQSDGTFIIKNVPTGEYDVQVYPPEQEPESTAAKNTPFPIPAKRLAKTGFTCQVSEGTNTLTLDFH